MSSSIWAQALLRQQWVMKRELSYIFETSQDIDWIEKIVVHGLFGLNDELFTYLSLFKQLYNEKKAYTMPCGHRIDLKILKNTSFRLSWILCRHLTMIARLFIMMKNFWAGFQGMLIIKELNKTSMMTKQELEQQELDRRFGDEYDNIGDIHSGIISGGTRWYIWHHQYEGRYYRTADLFVYFRISQQTGRRIYRRKRLFY